MKFSFLGGAGEVGRSAYLIEDEKRLLFDHGIKLQQRTEYPLPFQGFIDYSILSHAHLDHSGFIPAIYEYCSPPCIATYPTQALSTLLVKDSMKVQRLKKQKVNFSGNSFRKMLSNFIPLPYGQSFSLSDDISLTFTDAGHISGAAISTLQIGDKKVVYTGDFKLGDTWMHKGAECIDGCNILLIESTYSQREHPDRKKLEEELYSEVNSVLERGGNALLPCFAVGRSQEIIQMLRYFDGSMKIFLDGMAKSASEIMLDYPSYLRDAKYLSTCLSTAEWVNSPGQRRKALSKPSVIVSPAGMLEGGPSLSYALRLNEESEIILTGFQVPGTNGSMLLEQHKMRVNGIVQDIKVPVNYFDLSAHASRSDLFRFVDKASPEKVFCVHGDTCREFAEELRAKGYDAVAPANGESFVV
ncbi:MBL fold metallo-hydrolase [Candidatus Micrarchaeota archaeon]|nr:MBL fold metallo-hydrolase [Candidatus Micrarchaeota archaeon]